MGSRIALGAFSLVVVLASPSSASGQADTGRWGRVSIIQMPFTGARNVPEISDNPSYLYRNGVSDSIRALGFGLEPDRTVGLTVDEDREYGSWHRDSIRALPRSTS